MKIDVNNITFYEHIATNELQVRVGIRGEDDPQSPFAEVTLWMPRRNVPLSELKKDTIDATFDFLKSVVASRP